MLLNTNTDCNPHKQPRSSIPAKSRMICWNQDYCSFMVSGWSDASWHHHTSWLWCSNPHDVFHAQKEAPRLHHHLIFMPIRYAPHPHQPSPKCPLTSAPCSPACHIQENPLQPVSHLENSVAFNSSSGSRHQCPAWPPPVRIRYSKHCQLSQCCVPVWFHTAVLSPSILYPCCLVSFLKCLNTKATLRASKKQGILTSSSRMSSPGPSCPGQTRLQIQEKKYLKSEVKWSQNVI